MMTYQSPIPDINLLRRLRHLDGLSEDQLIVLANQLRLQHAGTGDFLLHQRDTDPRDIYLTEGKVELVARDGKKRQISVNATDEIVAIAQLRPSIYDVIACNKTSYLQIDTAKLIEFAKRASVNLGDISVHTLFGDREDLDSSITRSFYQHLIGGLYRLPPLPSAASRIQTIYRGESTDVDKLVHILVSYPDVVRVLEAVSRVRVTEGSRMTDRIRLCLRHLGVPSAYYLIMMYSVGSLIHRLPQTAYRQILPWWEHCLDVAALSRMLAKKTSLLSPDLAMMTGLIHGIGAYALVDFLAHQEKTQPTKKELDATFFDTRGQLSGLLLRKWDFGNNVIIAAEECGQWSRQHQTAPDLCDLVLVANYFAQLRTVQRTRLPLISKVPAFSKLKLDEKHGIELMQHIDTVKNNIKKLFSRLETV